MTENVPRWPRQPRSSPTVTFRLPNHELLDRLNEQAAGAGIDRSAYIRRALLRAMDTDNALKNAP
jgi:hypothetical protein